MFSGASGASLRFAQVGRQGQSVFLDGRLADKILQQRSQRLTFSTPFDCSVLSQSLEQTTAWHDAIAIAKSPAASSAVFAHKSGSWSQGKVCSASVGQVQPESFWRFWPNFPSQRTDIDLRRSCSINVM